MENLFRIGLDKIRNLLSNAFMLTSIPTCNFSMNLEDKFVEFKLTPAIFLCSKNTRY